MIELYQAEWCPHSHRVRERMTELGLDFVARQVPLDPTDRTELERVTGGQSIPTIVFEDGTAIAGDDEIIAALAERFLAPPDAVRHRAKAAEEWPEWVRLALAEERALHRG